MLFVIGLAALAALVFYRWATANDAFFVRRRMPHLRPTFLLGNTGALFFKRRRPNEYFDWMHRQFPNDKYDV